MNTIKKTLPIALIIGEGRLRGNANTPKISATRRTMAIIISSQIFSFRNVTPEL
jgi:hypothetical protein